MDLRLSGTFAKWDRFLRSTECPTTVNDIISGEHVKGQDRTNVSMVDYNVKNTLTYFNVHHFPENITYFMKYVSSED